MRIISKRKKSVTISAKNGTKDMMDMTDIITKSYDTIQNLYFPSTTEIQNRIMREFTRWLTASQWRNENKNKSLNDI